MVNREAGRPSKHKLGVIGQILRRFPSVTYFHQPINLSNNYHHRSDITMYQMSLCLKRKFMEARPVLPNSQTLALKIDDREEEKIQVANSATWKVLLLFYHTCLLMYEDPHQG